MADAANPRIAILLSTWNGARFLGEQLTSLLAQSFQDWQIYWRDDGSQDDTVAMMQDFGRGAGAGRLVDLNDNSGHVGITASFLSLLRRAPQDRIVAFCDQDDVWLPEKLARGVTALAKLPPHRAGLYCARQKLVDAALSPMRDSDLLTGQAGFPQSLTQNVATGCTVMLNQKAAGLLAELEEPDETLHDWWAYILVSALDGEVIYDDAPTVLYRQHAENAVGVPMSRPIRAVAALRRGPHVFMRLFRANLRALESNKQHLPPASRQVLDAVSQGLNDGWSLRLRALSHPGLKRQSWAETQLFRLWFLLG